MNIQRLITTSRKFLVTGIGKDRRGIARDITSLLINDETNIADTRMTKFQQSFTLMLLVEVLEKNISSFQESIRKAQEQFSIHINASEISQVSEWSRGSISITHEESEDLKWRFERFCAEKKVKFAFSEQVLMPAPMGGSDLFSTQGKIIDENRRPDELYNLLESFKDPLIVSLEVQLEKTR